MIPSVNAAPRSEVSQRCLLLVTLPVALIVSAYITRPLRSVYAMPSAESARRGPLRFASSTSTPLSLALNVVTPVLLAKVNAAPVTGLLKNIDHGGGSMARGSLV